MARNRQVATLPRHINPASIHIGDLISVRWTVDDVTMTRRGRVAKRDYEGSYRVLFTAAGHELFRWHPAYDKRVVVTLIEPAPPVQTELDFSSLIGDRL